MASKVVVVGAGIAGLTAGRRSQQLQADVLVLEKGGPSSANNTRRSGGIVHAAYLDPRRHEPAELLQAIMRSTEGQSRPDVARAWSDNARRAIEFLDLEGAVFIQAGEDEMDANRLGPEPFVQYDLARREPNWKGAAPDRLLNRMIASFVSAGGVLRDRTQAVALRSTNGRVTGVVVENEDGRREDIEADAVILADGGFQASPDLMRQHVTTTEYCLLCSDLETGDGLRMGEEIGALTAQMDQVYAWIVLRDQLVHEGLAHPPAPTMLIKEAIVVDGTGRRIGDEARRITIGIDEGDGTLAQRSDKYLAGQMLKSPTAGPFWVIFDQAVWDTAGRRTAHDTNAQRPDMPHPTSRALNPTLLENGGTFFSADTLAGLAEQTGIEAQGLELTVAGFNRFCVDSQAIDPIRSGTPTPIVQPPFHAIPVIPGIFFVMGGLLVNGNGQVLGPHEAPIPGLYAAGGTMGGLQGGPHAGYSGGWSEAMVFGLLSAEHAAQWKA